MSSESAFPTDFNVGAFFSAVPANLKRTATNGESHLKILGAQAKSLQTYLGKAFSLQLTYAQALEAAARSYGFSDYNQARACRSLQMPREVRGCRSSLRHRRLAPKTAAIGPTNPTYIVMADLS